MTFHVSSGNYSISSEKGQIPGCGKGTLGKYFLCGLFDLRDFFGGLRVPKAGSITRHHVVSG
jgi:hypothetical protein